MDYQATQTGEGVSFPDVKLKPAIARRIEWLGKMNDRYTILLANRDNHGLLVLASEYEEKGMMQTATKIRLEVSSAAPHAAESETK